MKKQALNPYLPCFEYIPDGEPHVFGDRIYIYGSHDRFDGEMFCLNDYICYSASVQDLTNWRYEGVIFRKDQDPRNAPKESPDQIPLIYHTIGRYPGGMNREGMHALWAPDVVCGPDDRYYLYYCMDFLPEIGVAVCDTPAGKFEYLGLVHYEDGTPLGKKEGDLIQFDPGVFIDEDHSIYLYSGNAPMHPEDEDPGKGSQVMRLKQDMLTLAEAPKRLLPMVTEEKGTGFEGHAFFEASSIRKIQGKYYLIYSSVLSHELCYAVSDYPDRDYRFGGTVISIGDVGLGGRTEKEAVNCLGNTHGSIEQIGENWYVFYHRQTNRTQYSRQACAEKIRIEEDGTILQTEVTSCGLNAAPLEADGTYPASICCHLTGKNGAAFSDQDVMKWDYPFITQDAPDYGMGDPDSGLDGDAQARYTKAKGEIHQYIANIQDGTTIGYKYFQIKDAATVFVKLRGRADGCIRVYTDGTDTLAGSIPVRIFDEDWQTLGGACSLPEGVHSLYFVYEGSGWLDMLEFGFA